MSIKGKSQSKVNFRAFSHRRHLDGVYGNEIVRSAPFSANKRRAYTRKKHFEFFVNFFRFRTPQNFQQKIILLFYLFCLFFALSKRLRRPAARPRNGRFFAPDPPVYGDYFRLIFCLFAECFFTPFSTAFGWTVFRFFRPLTAPVFNFFPIPLRPPFPRLFPTVSRPPQGAYNRIYGRFSWLFRHKRFNLKYCF